MTGRMHGRVVALLTLPLLTGACSSPAAVPSEVCTYYDNLPIVPPTKLTILTDTVDVRETTGKLLVGLPGYEWNAVPPDRVRLNVEVSGGIGGFALLPEPRPDDIFRHEMQMYTPAGEYHIVGVTIERATASCPQGGMFFAPLELTRPNLEIADSVFVVLSNY